MKNKILFFFVFVFSLVLHAQTKEERNKIIASYDFAKNELFKAELKKRFVNEKLFMQDFLSRNALPHSYTTKDGAFAELQFVTSEGYPIYYMTHNTGAGITIRANRLHTGGTLGLNVNGQNMIAGVWDGGAVRTTHNDFGGANSRVTQRDGATTLSAHSTHVSGTICGSGTNPALHRGVAYQSSVWAHDWNSDILEVIDRCEEGLLVSNHSYGFGLFDNNGNVQIPQYYFGAYIQTSQNWDIVMNMYPYYQYVTAAGNDRASNALVNDKGGYDLLSGTKLSKNGITVGAVNQVTTYTSATSVSMSDFSNWGPSDDSRIKPDIVAKGVSVLSPVSTSNTSRASYDGTSMASPGVAGGLLLLQQHHNNVFGSYMRASTVKGLTLHTADEAGGTAGPDYQFGWGLMNCEAAANAINNNGLTSIIRELTLNPGETITVNVKALGGTTPLMASISWTDPAGPINEGTVDLATPVLVNDLDIRVTNGSSTFFPWKLTAAQPFLAATTGDNIVDPFEKIQVNNANGDYTITITHKGTLEEPQNFALVVTGVDSKFTIRTSEPLKTVCTTQNAVYNFQYITNSTIPTNLSVANLPAGVNALFNSTSVNATGNVTLTLSNLNGVAPGLYSFDVIGNNGLEEEKVTVQLRVYSAVFTPIVNQSPNNTAINQSIYANLTWDADVNAENYEVQISTNSGFTNIVESATVSTNSFISAGLQLDTQYFWRVRPTNRCGQGSYTNPIFFITVNLSCNTVTNNTVATIASVANTVVNSTINFNDASITSLYDIDVDINITHTWVQDMTLTLISPQGTAVALLQENCSSEDNINATFDDNGGNIVCSTTPPAISGRVKPVELLSQFIGENPNGTWTLEVNDPWNGDGGTLNSWSIKVCKQIASNLSTKDIAFQNLSVWPNPANNIVNISFESDANDIVTIEMFDIQGRILKQQKADASIGNVSQSIDVNSLPVGVYVLKMTQGNKQFNSKIVKQ